MNDFYHLPPHCVNVFIPLVDLNAANGPTEFIPTSQLDWGTKSPPLILHAKAGECIIFDHRIKHRGLGNRSNVPRPLVYITYSKPWYVDINNSTVAGYLSLPPIISRVLRTQKRLGDSPEDGFQLKRKKKCVPLKEGHLN